MTIRSSRPIERTALVIFTAAIAIGAATRSSACNITASNHTVVVTGMAPLSNGRLCMSTSNGRECRDIQADRFGLAVAEAETTLAGPVWLAEKGKLKLIGSAPCTAVSNPVNDPVKPVIITLLTAFAAFVTGMSAALVPRWLERRHRSRELATAWVGEYLTRMSSFIKTGIADPEPLPLPLLSRDEEKRLLVIVTIAGSILNNKGYLGAMGEDERRSLVMPIIRELRAYPNN